jgi:hypothetical protein
LTGVKQPGVDIKARSHGEQIHLHPETRDFIFVVLTQTEATVSLSEPFNIMENFDASAANCGTVNVFNKLESPSLYT